MAQTTINIDTDIKEDLKMLNEMIDKIKLLEDKSKMLQFITIEEFAKLRQCSIKTAQDIFRDKTFPSENYGKLIVVELQALKNWYQVKRDKKNNCA